MWEWDHFVESRLYCYKSTKGGTGHRSWRPKSTQNGSLKRQKIDEKRWCDSILNFYRIFIAFWSDFGSQDGSPGGVKIDRNSALNPKSRPRGSRDPPGTPRDPPGTLPRPSGDPLRTLLGPVFGDFFKLFQAIFFCTPWVWNGRFHTICLPILWLL